VNPAAPLHIGVDFGLTTTDAFAYRSVREAATARVTLQRPGPASEGLLRELINALDVDHRAIASVAVTGGRSRSLPDAIDGIPIFKIAEPEAIGRGGLWLSGLPQALVISCGTGTAMVLADERHSAEPSYQHVTGTAVGGGTLLGLSTLLLGEGSADALAALAEAGDPSGVDTTLGEVLGGGVGHLPPEATAVNLGRLVDLPHPPNLIPRLSSYEVVRPKPARRLVEEAGLAATASLALVSFACVPLPPPLPARPAPERVRPSPSPSS
jgi:type II pantothenate kinase